MLKAIDGTDPIELMDTKRARSLASCSRSRIATTPSRDGLVLFGPLHLARGRDSVHVRRRRKPDRQDRAENSRRPAKNCRGSLPVETNGTTHSPKSNCSYSPAARRSELPAPRAASIEAF